MVRGGGAGDGGDCGDDGDGGLGFNGWGLGALVLWVCGSVSGIYIQKHQATERGPTALNQIRLNKDIRFC